MECLWIREKYQLILNGDKEQILPIIPTKEKMKILAVCGFGVGSSMVLKMTIDKVIKELGLKATAENTDLSTAKSNSCRCLFYKPRIIE